MRNFDYLKDIEQLKDLYDYCSAAEENQQTYPDMCAIYTRKALEWFVKTIYTLKHQEIGERTSLYELVTNETFTSFIDSDRVMMYIHYVRKIGNNAAHNIKITKAQSFYCLLNIYNTIGYSLLRLGVLKTLAPFNKDLIPNQPATILVPAEVVPEPTPEFVNTHKAAVQKPVENIDLSYDKTEAETRRMFIDLMLEEAGWSVVDADHGSLPGKACIEVKVMGMPSDSGEGYADYVLFGNNGKPLAVIEAKRTTKDPHVGKHQAKLYADCLEAQYGVRPVIYYSNGYTSFIIDGLGYPERAVYGFHTINDLEILIQRRGRKDITDLTINDNISDREYQKRGIKAICEHFNKKHRRGLLVMATGTGKTRTAISLVDVLMKNNWIKNTLFLADRTALVNQAHKNFVKLQPNTSTAVLNDNKEPDKNARILFSTYQTMINYIDTDSKEFSVGRFDLIIIDEAHRSVFGKYGAIFNYFDSLLVGLTATPRDEVERSTYDLFELESGEPNFAYELEEAVADGYLVDYSVINRTTDILQTGIKYDNLTDEEKEQLEKIWQYESTKAAMDAAVEDGKNPFARDINAQEIFKYIYNENTIDKVLIDLMDNGLKIKGGDLIGKSIIFAFNHKHANLIVERFGKLYPEYGPDFCVLIDNQVKYAQDLINSFEEREKLPQIVVSVDMMDTGIDVPDVLNLVFFKKVYSKIKFWQMIGRGTRLCKDIFGPGHDKEYFTIFDWCGNFDFFKAHPKGKEPLPSISLTERLFGLRCDLACALQSSTHQSDDYHKQLHDDLKALLKEQIRGLNDHHISVRDHWDIVDKFRQDESWVYLSALDVEDLKREIAPLLVKGIGDEGARRFDVMVLNVELSLISEDVSAESSKTGISLICGQLLERASIPQVAAKISLLKEVTQPTFWENLTMDRLEKVRTEVRELVKFILGSDNKTFTIDIFDNSQDLGTTQPSLPRQTYKQRVIDFLATHRNHAVIRKIQNLHKLTEADILELENICWSELGSKEEYEAMVRKEDLTCGDTVAAFIRSMVGIDRKVALEKFTEFISGGSLNSEQEEFLKSVISYVCANGDITKETIINDTPFRDINWMMIFQTYTPSIPKYIDVLHNAIYANAAAC